MTLKRPRLSVKRRPQPQIVHKRLSGNGKDLLFPEAVWKKVIIGGCLFRGMIIGILFGLPVGAVGAMSVISDFLMAFQGSVTMAFPISAQ